jgi:serine/threonine protein kinase
MRCPGDVLSRKRALSISTNEDHDNKRARRSAASLPVFNHHKRVTLTLRRKVKSIVLELDCLDCPNTTLLPSQGGIRECKHGIILSGYKESSPQDKVCVKALSTKLLASSGQTSTLKNEMDILEHLQGCSHITNLCDAIHDSENNMVYLIFDRMLTGDLLDSLEKNNNLTETIARRLARNITEGVHQCHSRGVAHRDISPENVVVDENWNAFLTDFDQSIRCQEVPRLTATASFDSRL